MDFINSLINKYIQVVTNDNRCLIGKLNSADNNINCIITNTKEIVYDDDNQKFEYEVGVYLIRGDNVVTINEI